MNSQSNSSAGDRSTVGRNYLRSADDLIQSPEFTQWLSSEFPAGAQEALNAPDRRQFLKLMSASFMLAGAGAAGCRRPVEEIVPFNRAVEGYTPGVSSFYATARPLRGAALPLLAKSYEGRPIKLEGNASVPGSRGATDAVTQASILSLYDPDRSTRFTRDGAGVEKSDGLTFLNDLGVELRANAGAGVAFLWDGYDSPSRDALRRVMGDQLPESVHYKYDPYISDASRTRPTATYALDRAKVILTLGADLLGSDESRVRHIQGFSSGRALKDSSDSMNRLYAVESEFSITGASADHRLRVAPSEVERIAAAIAAKTLLKANIELAELRELVTAFERIAGSIANERASWIDECANDLHAHGSEALVAVGADQPESVHRIGEALNTALGCVGETVRYASGTSFESAPIELLRDALNNGEVDTLIIVGGNPVYNTPGDLAWKDAQVKARRVIRFGEYEDETSQVATWHVPKAHYLESWADGVTEDGSHIAIQPLIQPMYDGVPELEFLARLADGETTDAYSIVRRTIKERLGNRWSENTWKQFLHDGYLSATTNESNETVEFDWAENRRYFRDLKGQPELSSGDLEFTFLRSYAVDDGAFSNNGWLQEAPDPITKLTWDNAIQLSRATANALGVETGTVVRLSANGAKIEGPVWIQPGFADNTVGLTLGYGRTEAGRIGNGVGYDAYRVQTFENRLYRRDIEWETLSQTHDLVSTQDHGSMAGRSIVREANLEQYREHSDFANATGIESHARNEGALYDHPYEEYEALPEDEKRGEPIVKSDVHQWGMTIDLNQCVGCNACVLACQSENNIPIVGKKQVANGREMHWMRIDRYYATPETETGATALDDPQIANQPMLCQHCENAPCESVCPVNATAHDEEGLNVMVYNRCVGTRYCSNNCPYKVRRFNFFDYKKRPLDKLMMGPLAKRPKEELDLEKLLHNPDVTVRMRGVMEKCTFCIQRLEQAKISAKVAARDSGAVEVEDGAVKTACQEVCPAGAIEFGNLLDPESRVSKAKANSRNYNVLGYLETRPRTTYLARVRNPNPRMPNSPDMPYSVREYTEKAHIEGDPFESHHHDETDGHTTDSHSNEGGSH